jgi:hypothetical protein
MVHYLCIHESHAYLSGALWLALFIFLYQLTTNKLEERRAKRLVEKPVQAREA